MTTSEHEAFPFKLRGRTEVDQVADFLVADSQIVKELGFVFWDKCCNGFEFNDNLSEDQQVGSLKGQQELGFVCGCEFHLALKRDPPQTKFNF